MSGQGIASLLLVLVAAGAAEAQIAFEGPFTRTVSGQPGSAAAADFDEDGAEDLAVADMGGSAILVFLSPGGGALGEPRRFASGTLPSALVARDFDEDGHADVAFSFPSGSSFSVLFGDGVGNLGRAATFQVFGNPADLVDADFDGDGRLDLAVVHYADVVVALGDGAGGFAVLAPVGVPVTAGSLVAGSSADFDLDGTADLALVTLPSSSTIPGPSEGIVYLGRGDGAFDLASRFPVGGNLRASSDIVGADLDRDGLPDLAIADRVAGVAIHLNAAGDGTFVQGGTFDTGDRPSALVAADFDRDGNVDVVAMNFGPTRSASVLPGDGTGAFLDPYWLLGSSGPRGLAVGDFDADRRLDVALASASNRTGTDNAVAVHYNATPLVCRAGGVNARFGPPVDVLFVSDSAGGSGRRVELATYQPLIVFLAPPPLASGSAPFALFGWPGEPTTATVRALPFGLGESCFPMFAADGPPFPRAVWNNTGRAALGIPTHASVAAPSIVVSRPNGTGRAVTFTLQGIIADPGSIASKPASVTNSVAVVVR